MVWNLFSCCQFYQMMTLKEIFWIQENDLMKRYIHLDQKIPASELWRGRDLSTELFTPSRRRRLPIEIPNISLMTTVSPCRLLVKLNTRGSKTRGKKKTYRRGGEETELNELWHECGISMTRSLVYIVVNINLTTKDWELSCFVLRNSIVSCQN